MITQKQIDELSSGAYGFVTENADLKDHTSFQIGGPCELLIEPTSEKEIIRSVRYLRAEGVPFYVLGNGSNMLIRDGGYEGAIIKLGKQFSDSLVIGNRVTAQAGALLSTVAKMSFRGNLTGMEEISGIPGSIGGGVIMNAGAYGGEMKDVVKEVKVLDQEGQVQTLTNEECEFEYRNSRMQKEGMIVLEVSFELKEGDPDQIKEKYDDYTHRRTSKQPLDKKSAGSTFKRPEKGYASKLIDEANLRGYQIGGAQVSEKHCGFLINKDNASSDDMLALITYVQEEVKRQFGVELEPEVRIIGEDKKIEED